MEKNYVNDSDLIKVRIDETAVVYSDACKEVVILFNNKKAASGLSSITAPVFLKKDIIDMCSEMGLPSKLIYTEVDASQEKCFCSASYAGGSVLSITQRRKKGENHFVVTVAIQKTVEREM